MASAPDRTDPERKIGAAETSGIDPAPFRDREINDTRSSPPSPGASAASFVRDADERHTNPGAVPVTSFPRVSKEKTRQTKLTASRKTLYALIASLVALLGNAFGVFLFVTLSDSFSAQSSWFLWVDGLVSGIVVVYTITLVRQLHRVLGNTAV